MCGPPSEPVCDSGVDQLTGFVYDPGDHLPIYNALVYAPTGAVVTPTSGVNVVSPVCGCSAPAAYASANTAIDGSFTLTNVPTGAAVTIVVQLGKWQRVFTQTINPCVANTATNGGYGSHLTLPSTHLQGNIPLLALDTGSVDSMECVLRKMGVADSEFVAPNIVSGTPTATGRIHFYQGSVVAGGAMAPTSTGVTPTEISLVDTSTVMDAYDAILFMCQGNQGTYDATALSNLINYTGAGGRVFTTHYHYDLLYNNASFATTATWAVNGA